MWGCSGGVGSGGGGNGDGGGGGVGGGGGGGSGGVGGGRSISNPLRTDSSILVFIEKADGRTDGYTDLWTDGQTDPLIARTHLKMGERPSTLFRRDLASL